MTEHNRPETFPVTFESKSRGKTFEGSATVYRERSGVYYATVYYGERSKHTSTHTSSGALLQAECKMLLGELVSEAEREQSTES